MMDRRFRKWVGICILAAVIAVLAAAFLKSRPMIRPENSPNILFISIEREENGKIRTYDLSENEISNELANHLISIFLNAKIRNTFFPPPQTYEISDGSTHITIRVALENARSMFVHLCSDPSYRSAQSGDTHYHIVNSQQVYEDVFRLLSDELFSK